MSGLLKFALGVDWISDKFGRVAAVSVLLAALISAGNAFIRYGFDVSSNAWLEIQWYLFAAVFLLGAGYGLLKNAHVRIDFIASRLSARTRNWIDVVGIVLTLIPFCLLSIYLSWPMFMQAYVSGEMSSNAGGLIRWPAMLMLPLGFGLVLLQGVAEMIKRIGWLMHRHEMDLQYERPLQ